MNKNNLYPPETCQIIDETKEQKKFLTAFGYTEADVTGITAAGIQMLYFMVCLNPESIGYGTGTGSFVYKDGRVFKFQYNIHTPWSKGPRLSGRITSISQAVLKTYFGIPMVEFTDTLFGQKAFWTHTPVSELDDGEQSLRELMASLKAYCRKENLYGKLRKKDRAHMEWKKETDEKIAAKQKTYACIDNPDRQEGI